MALGFYHNINAITLFLQAVNQLHIISAADWLHIKSTQRLFIISTLQVPLTEMLGSQALYYRSLHTSVIACAA